MDGRSYKGNQGTGYATVLGESKSLTNLIKPKTKVTKKKSSSGHEPEEVWHYFTGEMNTARNKWADEGAKIMTDEGIDDIWTSSNPKAIKQQVSAANLKTSENNINQAQDLYVTALKSISTRGDEFTEDYIKAVRDFPLRGFDVLASGKWQFPVAQFKEPITNYNDFLVTGVNKLKKELDGKPPSDADLINLQQTYYNSPENEQNARSVKQRFVALTDKDKKRFEASAQRLGLKPWEALAVNDAREQFVYKQRSSAADASELARSTPVSDIQWTKKENGVTKSGTRRGLDKKGIAQTKKQAKSYFSANSFLLNDENYMDQLGVDFNIPIAEREILAIAKLAKEIELSANTLVKSSETRDKDSGLSREENTKSFSEWWSHLNSTGNDELRQHAAKWMFGDSKQGKVSNARVIPISEYQWQLDWAKDFTQPVEVILPGNALEIEYDSPKEAKQGKEKALKAILAMNKDSFSDETKAAHEQLIKYYEGEAGGNTVAYPLTNEFKQVFKELHNASSSKKKSGYKSEIDTDDFLEIGSKSSKIKFKKN